MGKIKVLLQKDNGVNTKHSRRCWSITRNAITLWYYVKKWWFGMILNQITKFQIKSK